MDYRRREPSKAVPIVTMIALVGVMAGLLWAIGGGIDISNMGNRRQETGSSESIAEVQEDASDEAQPETESSDDSSESNLVDINAPQNTLVKRIMAHTKLIVDGIVEEQQAIAQAAVNHEKELQKEAEKREKEAEEAKKAAEEAAKKAAEERKAAEEAARNDSESDDAGKSSDEVSQSTREYKIIETVTTRTYPAESPSSEDSNSQQTPSWNGSKLTASGGVNYGPTGKETYYNLDMSGVVSIMRNAGYSESDYPYWVRDDGCKMLGDYIMVAANQSVFPLGSIVDCSLGKAIVCDTGSFIYQAEGDTWLDIAVNW